MRDITRAWTTTWMFYSRSRTFTPRSRIFCNSRRRVCSTRWRFTVHWVEVGNHDPGEDSNRIRTEDRPGGGAGTFLPPQMAACVAAVVHARGLHFYGSSGRWRQTWPPLLAGLGGCQTSATAVKIPVATTLPATP